MTPIPVQIAFRDLPHSDAIEHDIRSRAEWLGQYCDSILGCRAMVALPHRHHHTGRLPHVRLELSVPGTRLVVSSDTEISRLHYAGVGVRDAFDKMRRCLQDFSREQRHEVKRHEGPAM